MVGKNTESSGSWRVARRAKVTEGRRWDGPAREKLAQKCSAQRETKRQTVSGQSIQSSPHTSPSSSTPTSCLSLSLSFFLPPLPLNSVSDFLFSSSSSSFYNVIQRALLTRPRLSLSLSPNRRPHSTRLEFGCFRNTGCRLAH